MKMMRKIAGFVVIAAGAAAICSAGFKTESSYKISQSIQSGGNADILPVQKNTAFKEGEVLTYRLHYGALNAGVAILEVKPDLIDVNGRKVYHIVGTGFTTGSTDWFYKVRDRYETYMDKDALLPWLFVRRVDEGGFRFSQDYMFNHYTKKVDIGNGEKYDVPDGIQDMVSAFYTARNLDFTNAKEGDIYTIDCFVDKELWPLKIKYVGKETIDTDLGEFRCLKFRPIVQKGRVFKKEEDLTAWISDDKNHIPMRVKANILIGSIKMDITGTRNLANETSKLD